MIVEIPVVYCQERHSWRCTWSDHLMMCHESLCDYINLPKCPRHGTRGWIILQARDPRDECYQLKLTSCGRFVNLIVEGEPREVGFVRDFEAYVGAFLRESKRCYARFEWEEK